MAKRRRVDAASSSYAPATTTFSLVPLPLLAEPVPGLRLRRAPLQSDDDNSDEDTDDDPLVRGPVMERQELKQLRPWSQREHAAFAAANRAFSRAQRLVDQTSVPSATGGLDAKTLAELAATLNARYEVPTEECEPDTLGTGWIHSMQQMETRLQREEAAERQRATMVSCLQYSSDPTRFLNISDGDTRRRNLEKMLDSFGVTRSHTQKIFHFWALQALLPKIYGAEWDSVAIRVLREHGLTQVYHEVMKMTPRRFGKTWGVAMFVVAALMNIPGIQIAIFSTGGRASKGMMDIVKMFVYALPERDIRRVVKYSFEELYVSAEPLPPGKGRMSEDALRKQALPTTSKLKTYPSNPKGTVHLTVVEGTR